MAEKGLYGRTSALAAAVCGIIAVAAVTSVVLATSAGQSDEQKAGTGIGCRA